MQKVYICDDIVENISENNIVTKFIFRKLNL